MLYTHIINENAFIIFLNNNLLWIKCIDNYNTNSVQIAYCVC